MNDKKPDLKIVPLRKKPVKPTLNDLEQSIIDTVDDYIEQNDGVSVAEVVGTLEMVKQAYMEDDA